MAQLKCMTVLKVRRNPSWIVLPWLPSSGWLLLKRGNPEIWKSLLTSASTGVLFPKLSTIHTETAPTEEILFFNLQHPICPPRQFLFPPFYSTSNSIPLICTLLCRSDTFSYYFRKGVSLWAILCKIFFCDKKSKSNFSENFLEVGCIQNLKNLKFSADFKMIND